MAFGRETIRRAAVRFTQATWLCIVAACAAAQSDTGILYGNVVDQTGALISSAKVTLANEATGVVRSATTDRGRYEFQQVRVGTYTVTVELRGFKTHIRHGVQVAVTEATRADFTMEVGSVEETVNVVASGNGIETRDNTLGGVIEQKRVVEMPLNGRNIIQLAYFMPGVAVNQRRIGLRGSPETVPGNVSVLPYVNGMRNTMNAVLIDGALNNDPVLNTVAIVPVPDGIEEFKIQTNLYAPEFGQGGGAVISIVTRSGGKDFHGSLYEFLRNDALDARNFFLTKSPKLRRNQFGATLGGPMKIGRLGTNTFFFTTYEGLRLRRGVILNSIVPTLAQRAGDFSASGALTDPVGGCITGNIIASRCFDPIAVKLIDRLWPKPNAGTNLFQDAPVRTHDRNQYLIKVDHNASHHSFSTRYVIDDGLEENPVPGADVTSVLTSGVPGFPVINPTRFQNLAFSDTFLITPRAINQFRFTYLRASLGSNLLLKPDNPADFGFVFPILNFPAMPAFNVSGISSSGAPGQKDDRKINNVFIFADSFSFERGAHSLRFGGEIRRSRSDVLTGLLTAGQFVFSGAQTGSGFADFLFGALASIIQADGDNVRNYRSTSYAVFFQDAYRVSSNLTFNYGLRWEVFGPFGDTHISKIGHPRMATFIAGRQSTYAPDLPKGILLAGFDPGVPTAVVQTDRNNVAPRIGFAWDPFKRGKTSIRAGYGIFYDVSVLEAVINYNDGTPAIRPAISASFPGPYTLRDPYLGKSPFIPPIKFPIPTTTIISPAVVNPKQKTSYAQQWNLMFQQQLTNAITFQIGYVGTKGTNLTGGRRLNQACFATLAKPCNGETADTPANLQKRRPFQGISNLLFVTTEFNSNYHSLQAELKGRAVAGLGFQAAYTWSKAIDQTSKPTRDFNIEGQSEIQNDFDLKAERALSAFDIRHRFVANFTYELPFARKATGLVKHLAGNWQANGIVTLQSGQPFTPIDSRGRSLTGSRGERPDAVCDGNLPPDQRAAARWFNTSCFQAVPLGVRFGTAARNSLFADGTTQFDFSILKSIRTSEKTRLEFRTEVFNLFNHPDFAAPINDFASPAFGRVLATAVDERQIQFALKFNF